MVLLLLIASQQILTPQTLRPMVLAAASAQLDAQTQVTEVLGLSTMYVPRGNVTVQVSPLVSAGTQLKSGRVPARVSVHAGDTTRDLSAVLVLTVRHEAWCASHALSAQQIVEAHDVVRKLVPADEGFAESPVGSRLVHDKLAGEPLRRWDLAKVNIVQSRSAMTMWARSGGVQASAPVEARESGAVGDMIHVFNPAANKVVVARIISAHEVEVMQ